MKCYRNLAWGEVCQYLWVRGIRRTSSTESAHPTAPKHPLCICWINPGICNTGEKTARFTGCRNGVVASEPKAAFLLSPTQMNDLKRFPCMVNKCGFCCLSKLTVLSEGIFVLREQEPCHPEQIPLHSLGLAFLYGFLSVITHLCTSRFDSNQAMGEQYVKTVLTN